MDGWTDEVVENGGLGDLQAAEGQDEGDANFATGAELEAA
jgi:hypothetical protein